MAWEPCLIGWENAVPTATLYASSQEPLLPVSNLAVPLCCSSCAWQTAAGRVEGWVIVATPNAASAWRAVCVARTNLTASAQIRVRVGSLEQFAQGEPILTENGSPILTEDGSPILADPVVPGIGTPAGQPIYDSDWITPGVAPGFGQAVHAIPVECTGAACRIDIRDPGNPDGHLNIPGLYAGPAFQPISNYGYGSSQGSTVQRARQQTRGGQVYIGLQSRSRRQEIDFPAIRASEIEQFEDLRQASDQGENLLFIPNPLSDRLQREALYGDADLPDDIGYPATTPAIRRMKLRLTERL